MLGNPSPKSNIYVFLFQFHVSLGWDSMTALQLQPRLFSKVSVKIAPSKHRLTWALTDAARPRGLGFQRRVTEAAALTGPPARRPQPTGRDDD